MICYASDSTLCSQVDLSDNAVLESLFGDKSWKEKLHPVVTGEGEPLKMSRVNFWNATL